MELPRFVPEDLRQLLRFVPTRGWDAVAWRPMLGSLRSLSWRYASGRGVTRLSRALGRTLEGVELGRPEPAQRPLAELGHPAAKRAAGDRILHLYFRQWCCPEGLFIDLRPGHFHYGDARLTFTPNGLWIGVSRDFREGLIALYQAFYGDDEAGLDVALRQMGMLKSGMGKARTGELKALMRAHFGVDQAAQRFSIDAFKVSFDALFDFFLEQGDTLHSDFVVLGFNLITLYLALEKLGQEHDVRSVCLRSLAGRS